MNSVIYHPIFVLMLVRKKYFARTTRARRLALRSSLQNIFYFPSMHCDWVKNDGVLFFYLLLGSEIKSINC